MSTQKRFGPDNPLLRRVRRHATMATLFRATDPAASYQPSSSRHSSGSSSAVQATIVPQSTAAATEPTTELSAVEGSPVAGERPAAEVSASETSIGRQETPSTAEPSVQGSPPASPAPAAAAKTAAEPAAASTSNPPSESPPEPDEEDQSAWHRLQAIFRGHRQKESAEADTTETAVSASPPVEESPSSATVQRQEAEPPATEPSATPSAGREIAAPTPPESSQETAVPPTSPTAEVPAKQSHTPTPQPQRETTNVQPETADETVVSRDVSSSADLADTPIDESAAKGEAQTGSPPTTSQDANSTSVTSSGPDVQRRRQRGSDEAIVEDKATADTVDTGLGDETGVTEPAGPVDATMATGDPETVEESTPQSLPLEAVWPVQRKKDPTATPPATDTAVTAESPPPSETRPEEEEQVRSALQRVASGRPSHSSVELVGPRRPRPPAPARGQTETKLPPETSQAEPDSASSAPAPQAPKTKLASETAEAVPTEIGPLPADLWQLLGETPPAQSEADSAETVMRATETAETAEQASVETSTEPAPPPSLQRQAATTTEAETEPAPDKTETETNEEESEPNQVDVDELARRVYSDIKRRLGVEWERVRGRM